MSECGDNQTFVIVCFLTFFIQILKFTISRWHRVGLNFKAGQVKLAVDCKTPETLSTLVPVKFIDKRSTISFLPDGFEVSSSSNY